MPRPPYQPRASTDPTISPASIAARGADGQTAGFLPPPDDTDELPAGTRLGKYTIRFPLGRGGMGTVYEAMDSVLHRKVALKVLPRRFAENPEALKRFVREAQLAARLNHPNAVLVYDVAKKDATYFIAMELVPGTSGQEILLRGTPLDWRDATRAIADACRALGAAHQAGLVHRDIKPSNLLWSESGSVKLSDFGLAKPTDPRSVTLTQQDAVIGTPLYMSPEQCRNEGVDGRSDIYSMGATYFSLLTGSAPYEKGTALQILFAHCSAPIPNASEIRKGVPVSCAQVIRRAMAKNPDERYQSAGEMILDLEALLAGEPVSTAESQFSGIAALALHDPAASIQLPDVNVGRSQTIVVNRRVWTYALVAAGVIVLLLGGLIVALVTSRSPSPGADTGSSSAGAKPIAPTPVPQLSPARPVVPAYVDPNPPVIVVGPNSPVQIPSAGVVRPTEPNVTESVKPAGSVVAPTDAGSSVVTPTDTTKPLSETVPALVASNVPPAQTATPSNPISPTDAQAALTDAQGEKRDAQGATPVEPVMKPAEPAPVPEPVSSSEQTKPPTAAPVDIAEASQREPVLKRYLAVRLYTLNARKSGNTVSQLKAAKALVLWHDFFLKIPDPQAHHRLLADESLALAEELSPGISKIMPRENPGPTGPPLPPNGPPRARPENGEDPDRPRERRPPPPPRER